jgi:hypothetical protein
MHFNWFCQCANPPTNFIALPENRRQDERRALNVGEFAFCECEGVSDLRNHSCEGDGFEFRSDVEARRA